MNIIHRIFDWKGIPILILVFLVLLILESKFQLRKRVQKKWDRSVINNIVSVPSFVLLRFMLIPAMVWLAIQNEGIHFGLNYLYALPEWLEGCITFVILDYSNYVWHTLNHQLTFLWRFHLVHHTDLDLDVTTATRFHFGELIGSLFFRGAFVILTGATPLVVLIYEICFEAANLFHHSNTKLPLHFEKILNIMFVTPRMHGIHHSAIKSEAFSNYSVIFSFWDRIHRTIKLNVHQDAIVIGVPAYENKNELTVIHLFKLPFTKIRKWKAGFLERNIETLDDGKMLD